MKKKQVALLIVCTLLFGWFLRHNWQLLPQLVSAMSHGKRQWLLAAMGGQLLTIGFLTAIYHASFRVAGVSQSFRQLLPQSLAAMFIDSTAPAGGAAGAAIFLDGAHRRQQSSARTTAGMLLYFIANYVVFSALLLVALILMAWWGMLSKAIISMSAMLVLTIGGLCLLVWLGAKHDHLLQWLLSAVRKVANLASSLLLGKAEVLSEAWVTQQSVDFAMAATAMTTKPRRMLRVLGAACLMHLSMMGVLAMVLLAFKQPLTISLLLIAYAMNGLFTNVSPTPNGVGIVEMVLPPLLVTLGMPISTSVAVTLVFRAFTFWLPLLLGFIATRYLRQPTPGQFSTAQKTNHLAIS